MSVWYSPEINVLVISRMLSPNRQLVEWDYKDMFETGIKYTTDKDLVEYFDWTYIGEFE